MFLKKSTNLLAQIINYNENYKSKIDDLHDKDQAIIRSGPNSETEFKLVVDFFKN